MKLMCIGRRWLESDRTDEDVCCDELTRLLGASLSGDDSFSNR
ncbi:hypothetical protein [Pelagibaculum spongiae]|nr:hypothetical protein [Pelagibaculum spongiae]